MVESAYFVPSLTQPFSQGLEFSCENPKAVAILFHGMTSTPTEVEGLAEYLNSKGFHVFAPCLSGHGSSIENLHLTRLSRWIKDIENVFSRAQEVGCDKIFVAGESFGSLCALYLAGLYPSYVSATAVLSSPFELRPLVKEYALIAMSMLPAQILDRLWIRPKKPRLRSKYSILPNSYSAHSYGAAARIISLRRRVKFILSKIESPVRVYQDPFDHHVRRRAGHKILDGLKVKDAQLKIVPHGHHQLLLGNKSEKVIADVEEFFSSHL